MDIVDEERAGADLPLQQSAEFERALARTGRCVRRVAIRDRGARIGELLMMRRFGVWMASRGPQLGQAPCRRLSAALRREGLWLLNSDQGMPGYVKLMSGASVAELTLDARWRERLLGKWGYHLRRGERLTPERRQARFDAARDSWLLEASAQMARARGYRHWPEALSIAYAAANPGRARVFWAEGEEGPLGAVLILRHGARASYHVAWASPEGLARDVTRALLADAMDYLAGAGVRQLDLGVVQSAGAPGLARFKIEMGATVRQLGGTWAAMPGFTGSIRPISPVRLTHSSPKPRG